MPLPLRFVLLEQLPDRSLTTNFHKLSNRPPVGFNRGNHNAARPRLDGVHRRADEIHIQPGQHRLIRYIPCSSCHDLQHLLSQKLINEPFRLVNLK